MLKFLVLPERHQEVLELRLGFLLSRSDRPVVDRILSLRLRHPLQVGVPMSYNTMEQLSTFLGFSAITDPVVINAKSWCKYGKLGKFVFSC